MARCGKGRMFSEFRLGHAILGVASRVAPGAELYTAHSRTMWCGVRWPVTIGQEWPAWYAFNQYSSCSFTCATYSCPPTPCRSRPTNADEWMNEWMNTSIYIAPIRQSPQRRYLSYVPVAKLTAKYAKHYTNWTQYRTKLVSINYIWPYVSNW